MKKKILTVLVILGLLCAATVCASAADAETPKVIQPGDVNGDGAINATDAVMLAQYLAGWDVVLGGDSHTVVIDPAVPATCTQTGLTEGKHCSDCGMILVKQQVVPVIPHDFEETLVPPTTATQGYTLCKCKVCGHEEKKDFIPAIDSNGLAVEVDTESMTCIITGIGDCVDTDINIPEKISDYTVVGIADKAFSEQTQITSIKLPNTVKTLGQRAFYGCTGLTEFTVPASVTSIGHQVFYKCDNLATVYYNSDFSPDQDTFFLNIPSIKAVVFGGTVVPKYVAYNCSNIENVTIKNSVTSVGWYAFSGCRSLTSVKIPDSVTSIGGYAFYGCSSLKNLYIDDLESWLNVYLHYSSHPFCSGSGNFYVDGVLATDVVIPNSVTSIRDYAFDGCSSLTSIVIPDSVTSIGNSVFSGCSSLATVYYNSNFSPDQDAVFLGVYSIKTVVFGGTKVPSFVAYNCSNIEKVTIKDSVTSIGEYAFYNCSSLTSVEIPDSVTSIGYEAFYNCGSLKNLYITDLESWLNVSLRGYDSHPLYSAGGNLYIGGVLATDIEIPDTVTSIGNNAFQNCSSLTSVEIGNNVTSIDTFAFYRCSSLTNLYISDLESWLNVSLRGYDSHPLYSAGGNLYIDGVLATDIEIPDSVTSISVSAFYGCSSLTSIKIPDSVTSIGDSAFSGCSSLESITLPFVGGSRKTSSDKYQYPFGYIFGTSSYTGGVATTQYYYGNSTSSTTSSTYYIPSSLKHVTITGGNILRGAFYICSSLTSVEIGDSVTSIGDYAFYNCSSLTSVEIPDSVTSIGDLAFAYCSSLTSVKIPDSVTSIGNCAFQECSRLTSVEIPDSVTSICQQAFYDCSSLATVYYGGDVEYWATISFGSSVWYNTPSSRKVYYYSATLPTTSGNYWHYVDGKPTPW